MHFELSTFWLQKLGNNKSEYEDAFAPKTPRKYEKDKFFVALADGATESLFSSEWAEILTSSFVQNPFTTKKKLKNKVDKLGEKWREIINGKYLPWYLEEKVKFGSFSSFLGVKFTQRLKRQSIEGYWTAIAVGDTCIFQIRRDRLISSFPLKGSNEFGNTPALISSISSKNKIIWEKNVKCIRKNWKVGDAFILATDALAHWFLYHYENKEKPWKSLLKFLEVNNSDEAFELWIDELRKKSQIKNDDVTLLIIKV